MYKVTSQNHVITQNTSIVTDGYGSLKLKNIGTDDAKINDNIPLPAGAEWSWDNQPNVRIDENTSLRFANVDADKKILVQKFYFKEV